jgi:hypothetical protein
MGAAVRAIWWAAAVARVQAVTSRLPADASAIRDASIGRGLAVLIIVGVPAGVMSVGGVWGGSCAAPGMADLAIAAMAASCATSP